MTDTDQIGELRTELEELGSAVDDLKEKNAFAEIKANNEREHEGLVGAVIITLLYILGGLTTFAWVQEFGDYERFDRGPVSVIGGFAWPLFWAGKGSIAIMHSFHSPEFKCQNQFGQNFPIKDSVCQIDQHQ